MTGENPARKVRRPKVDNRRLRFLSREEANALLAELKAVSPDLHAEGLLARYCGIRAGEIHNLVWGDIDFKNGQILIREPKNGHGRFAFMTDIVREVLRFRYSGQPTPETLLFPMSNGKSVLKYHVSLEFVSKGSTSMPG